MVFLRLCTTDEVIITTGCLATVILTRKGWFQGYYRTRMYEFMMQGLGTSLMAAHLLRDPLAWQQQSSL